MSERILMFKGDKDQHYDDAKDAPKKRVIMKAKEVEFLRQKF